MCSSCATSLNLVRCKRFDREKKERKQNIRGPLLSRLWIKTAAVRTRSLTHVLCYYYSHVGASRGFAFVEFTKIQDAQTWMDEKKVAFQTHFNQKNKTKPHRINQINGSMQIGDRLTVDSAASKIFSGLPQNWKSNQAAKSKNFISFAIIQIKSILLFNTSYFIGSGHVPVIAQSKLIIFEYFLTTFFFNLWWLGFF